MFGLYSLIPGYLLKQRVNFAFMSSKRNERNDVKFEIFHLQSDNPTEYNKKSR